MNEKLRKDVKMLKAIQGITYKEIAEHLEINTKSFYNYLNNQYDLSIEKQKRLREIIDLLKE